MKNHKQSSYFSEVTRIEEVDSSRVSLGIILTICFLILASIVWAFFTQIDETVVTRGEVIPVSKVYTVQHLEGGVIASILVKEGEEVQEGQTLLVFDPTLPRLELEQIQARNAAIINSGDELQRLLQTSQNIRRDTGVATNELEAKALEQVKKNVKENSVKAEAQNMTAAPNYKMGDQLVSATNFKLQAEQDISKFNTLLEILTKRLTILLQEKEMYEKLFAQGVVAKKDYLELLRTITQVEEEINKAKSAHLETQYSISRLEERLSNIEVKSPVHGLVKGLQAHVSNVIAPGGFIMEIVPLENLMVEARIQSTDVGLVKIGDKVRVKVDTYDFTRFGEIKGKLVKISATTFLENPAGASATPGGPAVTGSTAFYKASVALEKIYVGNDPKKNTLLPGMTVVADIHTGTKSLLKYLLRPVTRVVDTAFREQ